LTRPSELEKDEILKRVAELAEAKAQRVEKPTFVAIDFETVDYGWDSAQSPISSS
jgi:hypothetical protein